MQVATCVVQLCTTSKVKSIDVVFQHDNLGFSGSPSPPPPQPPPSSSKHGNSLNGDCCGHYYPRKFRAEAATMAYGPLQPPLRLGRYGQVRHVSLFSTVDLLDSLLPRGLVPI